MEHEPKISFLEAFFLIAYIAITDIIGILLVLVGLDDFFIIDALTFPVTQLYFRMKGVRGTWSLWMNIAELIPYIGALPLRTIGVIAVVYLDHHPEKMKVLEKITHLKK
ncbi:MAG: hypothetical protein AAB407_01215 [Patescibacteria group bacterium]